MTTGKKILIGSVLFLVLLSIYGYSKAKKLKAIFEQITLSPVGFRNLKVSLKDIRFNIDVEMKNPTSDNFDVSGYIASLKRLNFFYKGGYLATAKPELNSISIPANNKVRISNIPVIVPTDSVLKYAVEFLNFDINKLDIEAVVDVAGSEFFIKN
jgi:hypothetical protein